ncbi:biofilm-associated surface protein [Staphylococcus aureus]|nr:biofilm-associated surface protein [Staphylococcus aureus]
MLLRLLAEENFEDEATRQLAASMLSASIYRASEKWCESFSDISAESYIKRVTPYIISGLVSR